MSILQLLLPRPFILNSSSPVCGSVLASDFFCELGESENGRKSKEIHIVPPRAEIATAAVNTQEKKEYCLKDKN